MIEYTEEDWKNLVDTTHIQEYSYSMESPVNERMLDWINTACHNIKPDVTHIVKDMFFNKPLEDMPLHINEVIPVSTGSSTVSQKVMIGLIASWRLKRGK